MGIKTAIQYADSTVNPIMGRTGCELLTDRCFARRLCARYAGRKGWPKDFTTPEHFPGRLEKALKWKDLTGTKRPDKPWLDGMPRVIFVNDLSDGFCPGGVDPDQWLAPCLVNMANSLHIWLLLTKWPDRMRRWMSGLPWVPDNFWLGTTLLRQDDNWRLDELLQIQGGKKWVSAEPLLGTLDLENYLGIWTNNIIDARHQQLVIGKPLTPDLFTALARPIHAVPYKRQLDFVTIGGETGPGARPMRANWARGLRDQCQTAGVSFFFKSWGEWTPVDQYSGTCQEKCNIADSGKVYHWVDGSDSLQVGNKRAGNKLDGKARQQMPGVAN